MKNTKRVLNKIASLVLTFVMVLQLFGSSIAFATAPGSRYVWEKYSKKPSATDASSQGFISSDDRSAYPDNGMQITGGYWYKFKGSDDIDASSLTASKTSVRAGETIPLTITGSSSPLYSGSLTFVLESSTDGGETWAEEGTFTQTSYSATAPSNGETQVIYRIKTIDGLGYESGWVRTAVISIISDAASFEDNTNMPNGGGEMRDCA